MIVHRRKKKFSIAVVAAFLMMCITASSFAAGSRNLVETTGTTDTTRGFRPYIEWYKDMVFHAGDGIDVKRQQSIQVYAKEGETICFGSSVYATQYDAMTGKPAPMSDALPTIRMTDVSGGVHYYDVIENGQGYITFAQEPYGPNTISGNTNGYPAFTYTVPAGGEGIYTFQFFAPYYSNSNPKRVLVNNPNAWNPSNQANGVAAWDVTVVDAGSSEKTGRTFANYLTMTLGTNDYVNSDFLRSKVHVLTNDGYIYETDFNGMNPDGFLFFANNRGLLDLTTGNSLYHSTLYTDNTLTKLLGNTGFHSPAEPDTELDTTYKIFFEYPSDEFLDYLKLSTPQPPAAITDFAFNNGSAVSSGAGGDFTFSADKGSSFQIEIMFNNDPNNVIYIANTCQKGTNTYHWDGKDYYGNVVPDGTYSAKLTVKAGEYHFPFGDAEVNKNGIQVKLENTPADHDAGFDPYRVYYDNTSKTINGDYLDFDPISGAPSDVYYGPFSQLDGVSSQKDSNGISDALRYKTNKSGSVAANGYGNLKLFDVWTYYSSQANIHTTPVIVRSVDVSVEKVWAGDADPARPTAITVQLFSDGKAKGTPVELNAGNGWSHTFSGLPGTHTYTVDEVTVLPNGYIKTITGNATTGFTITNTYKPTSDSVPGIPKTGDDTPLMLWTILLVGSAGGLSILHIRRRINKEK